jgi:hypothetical protein
VSTIETQAPTWLPLLLLSIVAPLGALDILWFHIHRFRLFEQPSARRETVTHLVRGFLFAVAAVVLSRYQPTGAWFWLVAGLFAFDFVNNVVDVALEEKSRAPIGGLPRSEYVIHIVGSTFAGAVALAFVATSWPNASLPTAMPRATGIPVWLVANGTALAIGSLFLTALEGALFARSFGCRLRGCARQSA